MAENLGGSNTTRPQQTATLNIKFDDTVSAVAANALSIDSGSLPADAYIINVQAFVRVAFDSGTTDALEVGHAAFAGTVADDNAFVTAGDLSSAGEVTLTKTASIGNVTSATEVVPLTAEWTGVGTAATAGEVEVVITYVQK